MWNPGCDLSGHSRLREEEVKGGLWEAPSCWMPRVGMCGFSLLPAGWTRDVGTAGEAVGDMATSLVGGKCT